MDRGLFISFEGIDGSGKSTQIELLKTWLEERGYEVVLTREPGGTPIGEAVREIILSPDNSEMDPVTEAMLYAASRAQHVRELIKPALADGKIVICDRFVDSSIAYQGYGRSLLEAVRDINSHAVDGCMPDLTFYLRLDPDSGRGRIEDRPKDRIEMEKKNFYDEVCRGYGDLAGQEPARIAVVDASMSVDEVFSDIRDRMEDVL